MMSYASELEKWKVEIRRGLIEMSILSLLSKREMYGYELSKSLNEITKGVLSVEEGTLYPLLRRLENKKYIRGEWKFVNEKARKYYRITPLGLEILHNMKEIWQAIVAAVEKILSGGNNNV